MTDPNRSTTTEEQQDQDAEQTSGNQSKQANPGDDQPQIDTGTSTGTRDNEQ